uniref:Uncharacterized protein n=1 Tax=Romanomermis culicivorax TaxID=13658 RepID=A0A915HYB2_ROMCU
MQNILDEYAIEKNEKSSCDYFLGKTEGFAIRISRSVLACHHKGLNCRFFMLFKFNRITAWILEKKTKN